jgi:TolB protein
MSTRRPTRSWVFSAWIAAAFVAAGLCLTGAVAKAEPSAPAPAESDLPIIHINDAGRELFKLALPKSDGDAEAAEVVRRDLDVFGLFNLLDPASFPPALQSEGLGFSSALWSQVGAQGVVKMKAGGGQLEGRLYMLGKGEAPILARTYKGAELRDAAHNFANDVVESLTGKRAAFGSRIAFAQTGRGKEIAALDMDGGRVAVVTHMGSDCLLPAFSPSGREIAFTSYLRQNPDLWIVAAGGGRARRACQRPGLNTGATWAGDGTLVLTQSYEGNAELYRVNAVDGPLKGRLTNHPGIDSSPSLSPDGSQIAFVSNRQGSPQIFLMPASGGTPRRLTFQGHYNQTPRFNPNPETPIIAFTGRDERGVFDVFTLDLRTNKAERVTQDHGSNSDPAWSPDGRLLVYASNRGGLFVANPQSHHEIQIYKGGASSPSWGPAPRR